MGGHNSGEVASSDVLHSLQFFYSDMPARLSTSQFDETIVEWLGSMNHTIESKGIDAPQFKGMGTTLVAFAYYERKFFWMNCGDSRCYHFRDGHLQQLSTDHSLNNLMGIEGHSNIITNCIGGGCQNSYIDIKEFTNQIQPGDSIMLCSDGLNDMINDDIIERMLTEGFDAEALCNAADEAGGHDNVSVVIARIQAQ
jgi:protein phosphatase